jgi:hypothetical protein
MGQAVGLAAGGQARNDINGSIKDSPSMNDRAASPAFTSF